MAGGRIIGKDVGWCLNPVTSWCLMNRLKRGHQGGCTVLSYLNTVHVCKLATVGHAHKLASVRVIRYRILRDKLLEQDAGTDSCPSSSTSFAKSARHRLGLISTA